MRRSASFGERPLVMKPMRRGYRALRALLLIVGTLCVLLAIGYVGLLHYLQWSERVSPSTQQVLVYRDGRRVLLVQPTPAGPTPTRVTLVAAPPVAAAAPAVPTPAAPTPTSTPSPVPLLPPTQLIIPELDVGWPVVLADARHMPRFKAVGWLFGSAAPGQTGNLVLFGHQGGKYGTLMRLHEIHRDQIVTVRSDAGDHHYQVREIYETTPDDVAVLAPTDTPTLTLITCSGPWDVINQTNERRLIVKAVYVGSA